MNITLLGASGMLGSAIAEVLGKDHAITAYNSNTLDITNQEAVNSAIVPTTDLVINCAAYTAVDQSEVNRAQAYAVNITGVEHIAKACKSTDTPLIHFSTDYVFDGSKNTPYLETDTTCPINYYGYTKEQGEIRIQRHLTHYYILRVQWLYGENGPNFVSTIQKLATEKSELSIINDQHGAPTWTHDVADIVRQLIEQRPEYGIYNVASTGTTTWFDVAKTITKTTPKSPKLIAIPTSQYPTLATRPLNSRLDLTKLQDTGIRLPSWKPQLSTFLASQK